MCPRSRCTRRSFFGAAAAIAERRPDARFSSCALVSRRTRDAFVDAQHRGGHDTPPLTLLYGHAGDALRVRSDVALVASGTRRSESALAGCPHVIFYRVSTLTARIVGRKLPLPFVDCRTCSPDASSCRSSAGSRNTGQSCAGGALNLFDDTSRATDREAVREDERRTGDGHRGPRADAVLGEL